MIMIIKIDSKKDIIKQKFMKQKICFMFFTHDIYISQISKKILIEFQFNKNKN